MWQNTSTSCHILNCNIICIWNGNEILCVCVYVSCVDSILSIVWVGTLCYTMLLLRKLISAYTLAIAYAFICWFKQKKNEMLRAQLDRDRQMFNFPYHNRHENQHHWQWLLCFVIMANIQFGTHISKALLYSKCNLHTYCYVWHSIHAFVFKVFVNKAWLSKYNIPMCSCVHTFHILLLQMVGFVFFFLFFLSFFFGSSFVFVYAIHCMVNSTRKTFHLMCGLWFWTWLALCGF